MGGQARSLSSWDFRRRAAPAPATKGQVKKTNTQEGLRSKAPNKKGQCPSMSRKMALLFPATYDVSREIRPRLSKCPNVFNPFKKGKRRKSLIKRLLTLKAVLLVSAAYVT